MDIKEHLDSLVRGNHSNIEAYLREVCKNEHVDKTSADMHIYMLKLDGNKRPLVGVWGFQNNTDFFNGYGVY